ncbi:MAG: DUF4126 domain-containing protein [Lautropia sp.]
MGDLTTLLQAHLPELAVAGALAWGAGIRLYLVVFVFGLASALGYWQLPAHLSVLSHPLVLAAAGFMMIVELFADKLPFLDTAWDAVHTFIRIPAGATLAAAAFGDAGLAVATAAAILGGSITATTHFSKAGTRAVANTSPEPLSNVALSFAEDASVMAASWLAMSQPLVFLGLLAVFLLAALMLMRWLLAGARRLFRRDAAAQAGRR